MDKAIQRQIEVATEHIQGDLERAPFIASYNVLLVEIPKESYITVDI